MIQVCAQCGTRWNVRDRQRVWCPRCRGTLLAPGATGAPGAPPSPGRPAAGRPGSAPAGYRWIAVRPGAPPAPRRKRAPLGPTPRYAYIPRWGLYDRFDDGDTAGQVIAERSAPAPAAVRRMIVVTLVLLGAAAVLHVLRYGLLLINRSVLLDPIVAALGTWLPVAASAAAFFAVVATALVLTNWLIARRAAAYAHVGSPDPRSARELWAGCLIPFVNLVLAPVFVIELARTERRTGLRIVSWWITWFFSYVLSVASIVTTVLTIFYDGAQRIADNTVITTVAYLVAMAALLLMLQVYEGFERQPVDRPSRRWVMVAVGAAGAERPDTGGESGVPVEAEDRNPAA
ncbi:hypothetical protein A7U43_04645 [Mycobacterium adipatum]|uniref:DUF4328 domain-containing protein n=1 Tax=Mycobacterium adipatum TaxID=1682113 RepID=A0A172UI73_9MYCO|nr:DUF4328 domain-containing protein [Mycobacterium adipatum]ANE78718.1 hypothetical protein A7U43_04645 [Mycobacterium adipatum]MBI5737522.1 DUF4328 domain-containing protein [Mycolicibacterium neoaurum]